MFWVPHPGKELGMGISILSYRGSATLGVIADAHLVPDPEAITQEFAREFKAMLKATREQKIGLVPVARRHAPAVRAKRARPRLRAAA
jgi:hypothetical protein